MDRPPPRDFGQRFTAFVNDQGQIFVYEPDIADAISLACGPEMENLSGHELGNGCWHGRCWLRSDENDYQEAVAFFEELAEQETGLQVFLEAVQIHPQLLSRQFLPVLKAAEKPSDVVQMLLLEPQRLQLRIRHQPLCLGRKRNRLPKLRQALSPLQVEALPLGDCTGVEELASMESLRSFLAPFFRPEDNLDVQAVHFHRIDVRHQSLRVLVDAPQLSPVALLRLARKIRNSSDLALVLQHRIASRRACGLVHEALGKLEGIESYSVRWDDKLGGVAVVADAQQSRRQALDRFVKRQQEALGIVVAYRFDTQRSLMVERIASSFPERGILTGIRHAAEQLYTVEAMIPQEDPQVLEDWSDQLEQDWGIQVLIEEPFLRAPDLRYMDRLGSDHETIALRFNRPLAFPTRVLEQARKLVEDFDLDAISGRDPHRRDIRQLMVISIDPARTRDLDDALSIQEVEPGTFQVGVHIADVSPFVPQGSPLDDEALKRGFTTYLLEGEIPVLPELLAN